MTQYFTPCCGLLVEQGQCEYVCCPARGLMLGIHQLAEVTEVDPPDDWWQKLCDSCPV